MRPTHLLRRCRRARLISVRPTVLALAALAALVMLSACGTSATVEPVAQEGDPAGEPTAAPAGTPQLPEPTAPPIAGPTPLPTPDRLEEPTVARADSLLGLSPDGRFGYAGTSSPWNNEVACDGEPTESLAGIDVERSLAAGGEPVVFPAGYEQVGAIRHILFSQDGRLVIVSSCGSSPGETVWFQTADLDAELGTIAVVGERVPLENTPDGVAPFVRRWEGEDLIETELYVQPDPDDFDSAILERQLISVDTGEIVSSEEVPIDSADGEQRRSSFTSPDGAFTYTDIADPGGALGCEGVGPARTFELDDGTGARLAMGDDGPLFSYLLDVQFGVDDLILWTSGCEGYTAPFVGRIAEDGTILDAHSVDTYSLEDGADDDEFFEYQYYRLDEDGVLIGLGVGYDGAEDSVIRLFGYDLSDDPHFVAAAGDALGIDEARPLGTTLDGSGSWFVGDTLSSDPACGARTLYGETSTGLARAFVADFEIDAIVDLDVSEARTQTFGDEGDPYTGRTIVVSTECPSEYDGRRVWFGEESGRVRNGLFLLEADLGEVAEVLSVRESLNADGGYPETLFVEVVQLDGTMTEIELVAVPYDN